MYSVWRIFLAGGRCRSIVGLAIAAAFAVLPWQASAQSSVGVPMSAATGRSLADAATQNLNQLIDQQLLTNQGASTSTGGGPTGGAAQLGGPRMNANGPGAGGTAAVTGALGGGAMPTGRLRTSEHEGLRPAGNTAFSYSTNEASAFANVVVPVPGTVFGGQLKFSALVGANSVSLDLKSNVRAALDPGQSASGKNESLLAGVTALWAFDVAGCPVVAVDIDEGHWLWRIHDLRAP